MKSKGLAESSDVRQLSIDPIERLESIVADSKTSTRDMLTALRSLNILRAERAQSEGALNRLSRAHLEELASNIASERGLKPLK